MDNLADDACFASITNIGALRVGTLFFRRGAVGVSVADPVGGHVGLGPFVREPVAYTI